MAFSTPADTMSRRIMATLTCLLILVVVATSAGQLQWKLVHNGDSSGTVPGSRRDAALAYDRKRNQLILFGGRTVISGAVGVLGDTWIFNLGSSRWREVRPKTTPLARFNFVAGVSGDYFYISTGESTNRHFLDDIWRFDLRTEQWEELPKQMRPTYYTQQQWGSKSRKAVTPAIRNGAGGGIFANGSRFYVSQGISDVSHADTFSYSLSDKGWFLDYPDRSPYNPSYPHARCLHATTMISPDELLIYGGCLSGGGSGGPCPSGDTWIFNAKTKDWQQVGGCASPRISASLAMLPSKGGQRRAILYGGIEKNKQVLKTILSPKHQVGVFNPDTHTWVLRETEGEIPSKRASASMTTGKDGIYMYGGIDVDGDMLNGDLYLLRGNAATADQAPMEAACHPTFFNLLTLHGIFMTLAWGFFLQWGAFIARYLQHKKPLWLHLHRLFQVFGLMIAIAGLVCGILSVRFGHFKFAHAIIGIVTMILGIIQPFNALVRPVAPEPGEERTIQRLLWEFFHKFFGRGALILGLVNISLGIFLAVTMKLLWALWFAYLCLLVLIHIIAECNHLYCGRFVPGSGTQPIKYKLGDNNSHVLFGEKHHGYENTAMESEG